MTACLNHIATFLFLFAVALTPSHLHVHARESTFFSKVTNHISESSKTSIPEAEPPLGVPVAAPVLSPAPSLSPVPAVEESGYHSGSNGVPSAPEINSADRTSVDEFEGKISGEELVGEPFTAGYGDAYLNSFNYDDNVNARSAGGFSSRDVYPTESQQGMSETRYLEKRKYFSGPKRKNSYGNAYEPEGRTASANTNNLIGDVYPTNSQQGMSDTRYLENGKYFYDPKAKNNYGNSYEPEGLTASGNTYNLKGDVYPTKSQQGMSDTRYLENGKYFNNLKDENSYGNAYKQEEQTATGNTYNVNENTSDAYEFDTMEEYYRKQGIADPLDQGVKVP